VILPDGMSNGKWASVMESRDRLSARKPAPSGFIRTDLKLEAISQPAFAGKDQRLELSNECFPVFELKADEGLLPDDPKTSRIEDKTVSAAEFLFARKPIGRTEPPFANLGTT